MPNQKQSRAVVVLGLMRVAQNVLTPASLASMPPLGLLPGYVQLGIWHRRSHTPGRLVRGPGSRSGFDTVSIELRKKKEVNVSKLANLRGFVFCKLLKLNGGRDRTRTCDLLRVKQAL